MPSWFPASLETGIFLILIGGRTGGEQWLEVEWIVDTCLLVRWLYLTTKQTKLDKLWPQFLSTDYCFILQAIPSNQKNWTSLSISEFFVCLFFLQSLLIDTIKVFLFLLFNISFCSQLFRDGKPHNLVVTSGYLFEATQSDSQGFMSNYNDDVHHELKSNFVVLLL